MTPLRVEQALNAAGLSGYAKNITSGSLQTARPNGLYHVDASGQVSGAPEKSNGMLLANFLSDKWGSQVYWMWGGATYEQRLENGNWQPWVKLLKTGHQSTLADYGITDGASKTDLQKAINDLVAGTPGALNTLQELAAALGNDANYAASITKQLSNKADKATTLAGYGITDGASKSELQSISPTGQIAFFATTNAPTGWLFANGQPVLRANYPALFAAIGTTYGLGDGSTTFNLPDLQGQFIRGWDPNHKVDTDTNRAFGREQGDAIRNINGRFGHHPSIFVDDKLFKKVTMTGVSTETIAGNSPTSSQAVDFDASRTVPTANETRPRNVALLACIKY
ncbi:tail fiber protein [Chromobacterium phragmitis]|uniref:Phage tail collar domain-containing protein n=1 Tax=Chromobacterium phragmitis TaxID=2202141 RepID=A0A344UIR5_9NEIS|nr:tail fiber protein [Chromobacterium phragmitis]AXE35163.1 hypothetical protein DK843_13215 [Chromobacterium phragmitis]